MGAIHELPPTVFPQRLFPSPCGEIWTRKDLFRLRCFTVLTFQNDEDRKMIRRSSAIAGCAIDPGLDDLPIP